VRRSNEPSYICYIIILCHISFIGSLIFFTVKKLCTLSHIEYLILPICSGFQTSLFFSLSFFFLTCVEAYGNHSAFRAAKSYR
jgi:hypothetical protein